MPEWLERELSAGLAPVRAPEALRDRVLQPRQMPARRVSALLIAAAMLVLSAGTVWLSARQPAPETTRWNTHGASACSACHLS
jgi:hypothetical protein